MGIKVGDVFIYTFHKVNAKYLVTKVTKQNTIQRNSMSKAYSNDAKEFLLSRYSDAVYFEEYDYYEYRGYKFDYFMSGIAISGNRNSYLLVDREYSQLWLFDYGNIEDRWNDFLKMRNYYIPKHEKKTIIRSICKYLLKAVNY